jgi:hypothetical protein
LVAELGYMELMVLRKRHLLNKHQSALLLQFPHYTLRFPVAQVPTPGWGADMPGIRFLKVWTHWVLQLVQLRILCLANNFQTGWFGVGMRCGDETLHSQVLKERQTFQRALSLTDDFRWLPPQRKPCRFPWLCVEQFLNISQHSNFRNVAP